MNATSLPQNSPASLEPRRVLGAGLVLALVLFLGWYWFWPTRSGIPATAYHEVRRGDLAITVVEPGTLAAVNEVVVRSEVEGTARIISIVPDGSMVKKGELLIELDSSQAQDQVNQQQIAFEKAKFAVEQARAQLAIQRSATNSDYLAADLKVRFAKIDQDKYEQGQRLVDLVEASNKLVQVEAQLAINQDTYRYTTNLAAKGYETKNKMDADRLAVLATMNSRVGASNGIWMLQKFDIPKLRQKYETDVALAEQELQRVVSQNERKMAQYQADLETQVNTLALSEEKLKRDRRNLEGTRILAPQDGLVVYQVSESRFSSESMIEAGAVVRNRQELIKLPDLSRMKITVKVHESHVNMVRPGQPAFIVLDSMPEERFRGVVQRVAPLPDTQMRWGNPNLKVYNTEIHITDTLPNVKPGVSAKAEIVITNIANALSVPIHAVTTLKGKPVVYLAGAKPEPRSVEVGSFNTKSIEVVKGLEEGDRVLLAPPLDVGEKELAGAILAEGEARGLTNTPVAPRSDATSGMGPGGGPGTADASGQPGAGEGGRGPGGRERGRGGFAGMPNREEFIKRFDKNGDGKLDEEEMAAARASFGGAGGQGAGRGGFAGFPSREEIMKRWDKNGDGTLDEEEQAAMRASFGSRGGQGGQGSGEGGGRPRNRAPRDGSGADREGGGERPNRDGGGGQNRGGSQ